MGRVVEPKRVIFYQDEKGNEPFKLWASNLRDDKGYRAIWRRVRRLERGNYGDCEPVGEGVSELRLFVGPGYRVYFCEPETNLVVILCGGTKATQVSDIKAAKFYQKEYKKDAS